MNDVTFVVLAPGDVEVVAGGNPRSINEKSAQFDELLASVAAQGVIVPIHVRRKADTYELLAGERRLMAAIKAGRAEIPAIDHGEIGDAEAFEITFAENFAREDLTVIEQGRAAQFMLERYKGDSAAAAAKMGKSVRWLMQRAAMAERLSKNWIAALGRGLARYWTASHLQLVAALPAETQDALLEDLQFDDAPSVKELEKMITGRFNFLAGAPWEAKKGCAACKKRSACRPGLWDDTTDKEQVKKNDRCLDPACWAGRMRGHLKEKFAEAKKDHPDIVPAVLPGEDFDYYKHKEIVEDYGEPCSVWKAAKEGGKGAVPAMIVCGSKAGDVRWIRPAGPAKTGEGQAYKDGRKTPLTLADKRKRLDCKRWDRVLQLLRKLVEETAADCLTFANGPAGIMAVAAVYGNAAQGHTFRGSSEQLIATVGADKESGVTAIAGLLWESVKPTLREKLKNPYGVTQTPDHCIKFGKWLAPVLDVDIDKLFAEVSGEKGYTEPKAWGKTDKP